MNCGVDPHYQLRTELFHQDLRDLVMFEVGCQSWVSVDTKVAKGMEEAAERKASKAAKEREEAQASAVSHWVGSFRKLALLHMSSRSSNEQLKCSVLSQCVG